MSVSFRSPLELYRQSKMTPEEFAPIADAITVTNGTYIYGRININTASEAVLACLPGFDENPGLERTLVDYRKANPTRLGSIGWVVEALGQNNAQVLDRLQATDCLTTRSFQFTADIAALGPHGRGYQRVRFVLDTADGTPRIAYRQDLTHLGWALGKNVRQKWLMAQNPSR